jgi:hypothetical protein
MWLIIHKNGVNGRKNQLPAICRGWCSNRNHFDFNLIIHNGVGGILASRDPEDDISGTVGKGILGDGSWLIDGGYTGTPARFIMLLNSSSPSAKCSGWCFFLHFNAPSEKHRSSLLANLKLWHFRHLAKV